MLTIESLFNSSPLLGQLRSFITMTTSSKPTQRMADASPKAIQEDMESTKKTRATTRPRRIPRITRPEPGSLYDILHDNAGASLYVLPICWSDIHADLLGVRFNQLDPILTPVPRPRPSGSDALNPSQRATALGRDLTTLLVTQKSRWFLQTKAIKTIMSTFFPITLSNTKTNAELDLFFGERVFKKAVRIPVVWYHPDSVLHSFDSAITLTNRSILSREQSALSCTPTTSKQLLVAYINRKQLKVIRANLFRVCPGPPTPENPGVHTFNYSVASLQELRSKVLTPSNEDHDAHYITVLLAMAQSYFYSDDGPSSASQLSSRSGFGRKLDTVPTQFSDVTVRLITHSKDPADFVVYTAVVTRSFLERFARPFKAPPSSETATEGTDEDVNGGLKISYVHVPIWPILGLKERMAKALGREIAGDAASYDSVTDNIETWHTQEELAEIKRQQRQDQKVYQTTRDLLSQGKKRRRSERIDRNVLVEMVNSSFEDNDDGASCASEDAPVLSPDAKRRCTRTVNPLEVC